MGAPPMVLDLRAAPFIGGLVLFKNQWFLYYGCADTFVGVATAPVQPWQLRAPDVNGTASVTTSPAPK